MSLAPSTSATMKPFRGRPPLPIMVAIVICALAFITLFYTETVTFLSSRSIFKHKYSCSRKNAARKFSKSTRCFLIVDVLFPSTIDSNVVMSFSINAGDRTAENDVDDSLIDDRFEFDPEECNVANGKWVFNRSIKPLYSDRTCPYLDRQVSCVKNGRSDSDYRHWEWQPEDCTLPRLIYMFNI